MMDEDEDDIDLDSDGEGLDLRIPLISQFSSNDPSRPIKPLPAASDVVVHSAAPCRSWLDTHGAGYREETFRLYGYQRSLPLRTV